MASRSPEDATQCEVRQPREAHADVALTPEDLPRRDSPSVRSAAFESLSHALSKSPRVPAQVVGAMPEGSPPTIPPDPVDAPPAIPPDPMDAPPTIPPDPMEAIINIGDSYQTGNFSIRTADDDMQPEASQLPVDPQPLAEESAGAPRILDLSMGTTQEDATRSDSSSAWAPGTGMAMPSCNSRKSGGVEHKTIDISVSAKSKRSLSLQTLAVKRSDSKQTRSTVSLGHKVRTGSHDIVDEVKNIASFEGCEELLRGSYLSLVLRNQARIFRNSSGSASTYAMSKTVKFIDAFISHNWCVPRWQKWLCLSLHFNLRIAMGLTFVVVSPLGVLAAYGYVPIVQPPFAPYPRSYVFRIVMYPVWLALLCFYRDIVRCFPSWSPIVFLDKTCIHQEDRAIQRRGIEKLGAFLCYSKTMVICYTDIYLLKLWTVYEVASFMTLQSVEQMRVVPVMFPIVFITSMSCLWAAGAIGLWPELVLDFYYTMHIFLMALCYGIIVAFRRWARGKLAIYRKMLTFSARSCTCFCEDDRPLVYANIAALMKETQDIGKDASEDAALACFDNLVRNDLCEALISSVGKHAMRYEHSAAVGCAFFAPVLDQLVGLAYGMPLRQFCSYALWYATVSLCIVPTTFIGFSIWSDHCLRFAGWREYAYLALGLVVVFLVTTSMRAICDVMELWANDSDVGLLVFAVIFVVSSIIARNAMDGGPGFRGRPSIDKLAAMEGVDIKETPEADSKEIGPTTVCEDGRTDVSE